MEINLSNVKINTINKTINTSITDDKIYFLVGKNGSGKTSVLKTIGGLIKSDSGVIYINNHPKTMSILKYKTYYLPENCTDFITNLKVIDEIKSIAPDYNADKLNQFIKLMCLNEKILKSNTYELSFTELKKIVLISMLLSNRRILLLDNVDTYLDQKSIDGLIKIIKSIKREKKIIIMVSNNTDLILKLGDSILVLDKLGITKKQKNELLFDAKSLEQLDLQQPTVIKLVNKIDKRTSVKFNYKNIENINDFIKEVYRNV